MQKIYIADKTTQDNIKNDTTEILAELRGQRPKRYGYRVKENESDPSGRVEYLYDAAGMTPAKMDFAAGRFDYGSWADFWVVRDNFPCMVKADGSVDYQLDPNDYSLRATTGGASDVANAAYGGNAMSAIPLVWVKRYQEYGYRYVIFCESQYDESYKAYAHTRPDGTISPYAYGPMYKGYLHESKLRSISGVKPSSGQNANSEINAAKANGENWTICTWAFWNLIHDLLILLGKSTDVKGVFGRGHTDGGSSADSFNQCGTLDKNGQFFGYTNTTSSVKVFHMENLWGERWERLVGLVYDDGMYKVKMTPENGGYNLTGDGYETIRKGITAPKDGGGWVKHATETEFGLFPTDVTGSSVTYDCTYHYYNPAILSIPVVGGSCADGSGCGRYLHVHDTAGHAGWNLGASPFLQNPS